MAAEKVSISFESAEELAEVDSSARFYKLNRSAFVRRSCRFFRRHLAASGLVSAVAVDEYEASADAGGGEMDVQLMRKEIENFMDSEPTVCRMIDGSLTEKEAEARVEFASKYMAEKVRDWLHLQGVHPDIAVMMFVEANPAVDRVGLVRLLSGSWIGALHPGDECYPSYRVDEDHRCARGRVAFEARYIVTVRKLGEDFREVLN